MKKFFSLLALVGVFAACQPETIGTTFQPDPAEVTITMTATDIADGNDVTAETQFSSTIGSVSGNVITIVGNPEISVGTSVTITAKYGNGVYTQTYSIARLLAGGKASYKFGILVGSVGPIPVTTNAQYVIAVNVYDKYDDGNVTENAVITASKGSCSPGMVYLEGNPDITATDIEISVDYQNPVTGIKYKTVKNTVSVPAVAAGKSAGAELKVIMGEEVSFTLKMVPGEPVQTVEHFTLKTAGHEGHATTQDIHAFTHDGYSPSMWLLNESEMILTLKTAYTAVMGNQVSKAYSHCTEEEIKTIEEKYVKPLSIPEISSEESTYDFRVSAWAYYNVVQTVIKTVTPYAIYRVTAGTFETKIANLVQTNLANSMEAVEYASNSHYEHGHGVGHSTHDEHGSTNAGGGIFYGD